jgi:hypothetical protein
VRGKSIAAVARENLDDATDRIGAIQVRCRAAQDFDVVDRIYRDGFQCRGARSGRAHPLAVDQHQRLVAVGAAQEHAAGRCRAAVHDDLDPGYASQQLGEALRAGAGDFFGADHRDVGDELRWRLRPARRRDHQRIERQCAGVLLRLGNTGEAGEDQRGQQVSGRERQTRHHFLRNAVRPRTAAGGRQRGENVRAKAPATSGIRPDIASPRCVSVRKPCANVRHSGAGRSPGWSVCERLNALAPDGPPSHARRAQWHSRTARTDLPLRGQRRLCRISMRRTGFPFHPRRQTGAADTCCGRVYRSAVTGGLRLPGLLYSSALRIPPKTPDRYP